MRPPPEDDGCALCRRTQPLTFHHTIPRSLHGKRWVRAKVDPAELHDGIWLCRDCHDAVHRFISHRELAESYRSLAALRQHPELAKFVAWIARQRGRRRTARPSR